MNRYSNIKKIKLDSDDIRDEGLRVYSQTVRYPEIPLSSEDIYIETDAGDNLPALSGQFYNDITLYWIIASANPNELDFGSIFPTPGTQLRIPIDVNSILDEFNKLNNL